MATETLGSKRIVVVGRISYPDIFKPRQGLARPDGTPGDLRYGCHIIMDPNGPDATAAKAAFMAVAAEKWGPNGAQIVGAMEASKKCIRVGNMNLDKAGVIRNGYQGMLYIVARAKGAPLILADKFANGKPVHVREDGSTWQDGKPCPVQWKVTVPYGGCYVKAQIDIYAMEGQGAKAAQGRSINCGLLAVQFVRDGEAFGGARADESDFSEVGGPALGPQGADPFSSDPFAGATAAPAAKDPFAM